jgi:anion-transporting  ArsA/GET3 family ATPase
MTSLVTKTLLSHRLILVTGKGGIGKSLTTAALALEAAAHGKKVLAVESSSQDQLAPLFGLSPVGHNLTAVNSNLSVINIKPQENFRDFVVLHLGHHGIFEKVFTKSIVSSFVRTIPGIAELTLLGRLYYHAELSKDAHFDLIILDGYASGHFLSLVRTPDAIIGSGLQGPVVEETRRVKAYIEDPNKTAVIQVMVAKELVVGESVEFMRRFMEETNLSVKNLIVNRAAQPSIGAQDMNQACSEFPGLGPVTRYLKKIQDDYERSMAALRQGMREIPWRGVPPQMISLRDLGVIPEPLAYGLVKEWLAAGQGEDYV